MAISSLQFSPDNHALQLFGNQGRESFCAPTFYLSEQILVFHLANLRKSIEYRLSSVSFRTLGGQSRRGNRWLSQVCCLLKTEGQSYQFGFCPRAPEKFHP